MLSILIKKMSDDNNEQITKVPEPVRNITNEKVNKLKTKDPKKLLLGKSWRN